jgi:transposase
MSPSISLKPEDRNALLRLYHRSPDPRVRLRAHVLLLLADGYPWDLIAAVLYTSSSTIARWQRRYRAGGAAAVYGPAVRRPPRAGRWAAVAVAWVLCLPPAAFGRARSRWCCEAVAVVLWEDHGVPVSRETVRRWLRAAGLA